MQQQNCLIFFLPDITTMSTEINPTLLQKQVNVYNNCFLCGNGAISLDLVHYFELNNLGTVRRTKKSGVIAYPKQQKDGGKLDNQSNHDNTSRRNN
jgi:hypothetical protein